MEKIRELIEPIDIKTTNDSLEVIKVIGKMIGEMFGPKCEIAISDLEDKQKKVIWIFNGNVTNRMVGSPLSDEAALRLIQQKKGYHLNYSKFSSNKKDIKASTMIFSIKGHRYSFCINYDYTLEKQVSYTLLSFLSMQNEEEKNNNNEDANVKVIQDTVLNELRSRTDKLPSQLNKEERIDLIHTLYHLNLFERQKSIPILANILNVSRYTIYNDIKYLKVKHKKKEH